MFIQMHLLQSLPPGNLNRDDTGQPKKCLFGGVTRGRISSQCLKRTIRRSPQFRACLDGQALRSQYLPKLVTERLTGEDGFDEAEASALAEGMRKRFSAEKKGNDSDNDTGQEKPVASHATDLATRQLVFFSAAFVDALAAKIVAARTQEGVKALTPKKKQKWYAEFFKDNAEGIATASEKITPDIALFGRMTTSDLLVDVEAICQVAHAISTHETIIESDYFTAMDDLTTEPGAAFLGSGDTETFFDASVYYKYMNLDLDALRDAEHMTEAFSAQDAAALAAAFLRAAVCNNPTGKQNSFAAHGMPELVLVEVSKVKQPISYANAFLQPVAGENLMKQSADALGQYVEDADRAFSRTDLTRLAFQWGSASKAALPARKVQTFDELVESMESQLCQES